MDGSEPDDVACDLELRAELRDKQQEFYKLDHLKFKLNTEFVLKT